MNNEKDTATVPFFVHESACERLMIANKRLWILLLVVIALLVAETIGVVWYESQWETVETTTQEVSQDIDTGDGDIGAMINGIGNTYGENKADNKDYND